MLTLLETSLYPRVQPLFDLLDIHLAVRSILAGSTPADVYVDSPDQPSVVLAKAGHRYLLAGRPDQPTFLRDMQTWFEGVVYPHAAEHGEEGFSLYYAPAGWEKPLAQVFSAKTPLNTQREYYTGEARQVDWRCGLPAGFDIRPVDAALLADAQLEGLSELLEEMCSERPSVADFMAHSFGVVGLWENKLAGWCLSEYNHGESCEIGIATLPPYRRRGLAACMSMAFSEMARLQGVRHLGWHCYASNTPSGATARKAGLVKACDYQALVVLLNG